MQIPLDRPREPWYLALNPCGLVPTLSIEDPSSGHKETIVESALICRFLLDLAPGWGEDFASRADAILPRGHDLAIATKRYRQNLFLEVHFEKLRAAGRALLLQRTEDAQGAFESAAKELDPLCPRAGLFFRDSETVSLVEVLWGPYLMRIDAHRRWGLMPDAEGAEERLQAEAPRFWAWVKMLAKNERVRAGVWDEEVQRKYITDRYVKAGGQVRS